MSSSDRPSTPPEVIEAARESIEKLLPTKSASVYEAAYEKFLKWCSAKNVEMYSENVLLAYFLELSRTLKSSSLWSRYSMVKSSLILKKNVDISKYCKLRLFLKKQGEGYKPKKAEILSKEEFDRFLYDAPDEIYLGLKIVLIFGISGACRCHELAKMKTDDIEDCGSLLLVKVPDTKTKKSRSFTILGEEYLAKYRKYISLRPAGFQEQRFFLKYQNGKCLRMVMGIHKLGNVAKEVAKYLKLPNWNEYTGHCLRRTSATMLVDGGGDITMLKRHGGWRSSSVAEGYVEESLRSKKDIACKILVPSDKEHSFKEDVRSDCEPSTSENAREINSNNIVNNSAIDVVGARGLFQNASMTNCVFHINVNNCNNL